jgi:hypothetical protein
MPVPTKRTTSFSRRVSPCGHSWPNAMLVELAIGTSPQNDTYHLFWTTKKGAPVPGFSGPPSSSNLICRSGRRSNPSPASRGPSFANPWINIVISFPFRPLLSALLAERRPAGQFAGSEGQLRYQPRAIYSSAVKQLKLSTATSSA